MLVCIFMEMEFTSWVFRPKSSSVFFKWKSCYNLKLYQLKRNENRLLFELLCEKTFLQKNCFGLFKMVHFDKIETLISNFVSLKILSLNISYCMHDTMQILKGKVTLRWKIQNFILLLVLISSFPKHSFIFPWKMSLPRTLKFHLSDSFISISVQNLQRAILLKASSRLW